MTKLPNTCPSGGGSSTALNVLTHGHLEQSPEWWGVSVLTGSRGLRDIEVTPGHPHGQGRGLGLQARASSEEAAEAVSITVSHSSEVMGLDSR